MNDLTLMQSLPINRKEYNGQPVVTLKDIDAIHRKPEGTAKRNFNQNKRHFVEGVDFFVRNPSEALREFGTIAPNGLKLFTQTGYLMIVKSFTDDLSWAVQRELVNGYFAAKQAGLTFMGTPVMPLTEAAKALGIPPRTALRRIEAEGFGMVDALLLEGKNLARFKAENAKSRIHSSALWILTRTGFEKLKQA